MATNSSCPTGASLCSADAISRLPLPVTLLEEPRAQDVFMMEKVYTSVLLAAVVEAATGRDPFLAILRTALWSRGHPPSAAGWRPFKNRMEEFSVTEGCVLQGNRVVVPASRRDFVLNLLQERHPGVEKIKLVGRSRVCWPGIEEYFADKVGNFPFKSQGSKKSAAEAVTGS